jgi:hypothetical protein
MNDRERVAQLVEKMLGDEQAAAHMRQELPRRMLQILDPAVKARADVG